MLNRDVLTLSNNGGCGDVNDGLLGIASLQRAGEISAGGIGEV